MNQNYENNGLGKICGYCMKEITIEDINTNNYPVVILNLPGFFHKKCKAEVDINLTLGGKITEVFNKERIMGE